MNLYAFFQRSNHISFLQSSFRHTLPTHFMDEISVIGERVRLIPRYMDLL